MSASRPLEGRCDNSAVIEHGKAEFCPTVVTLSLLTVKSVIFKDLDFLLHRHDETVVSAKIKTNN